MLDVVAHLFAQDVAVAAQRFQRRAVLFLQPGECTAQLLLAHGVQHAPGELAFLGEHADLAQPNTRCGFPQRQVQCGAVVVAQLLQQRCRQQLGQRRVIAGSLVQQLLDAGPVVLCGCVRADGVRA